MKKITFTLAFIAAFAVSFSQNIHRITEIVRIMDESDVTYTLKSVETSFHTEFEDRPVFMNNYYREVTDSGLNVKQYEPSRMVEELFQKAEECFEKGDLVKAREYYQDVLAEDPTYYKCLVYIGDTYLHSRYFAEAAEWYGKAVKANYIDYLAHWGLAHACLLLGQKDRAVREITIAKVLNRNNPRLQTMMNTIYKEKKLVYNNWYFEPQCSVTEEYNAEREKNVVVISYRDYWMPYAIVNAVWMYEPDYAEGMGDNQFGLLQNKEALAAMLTVGDKKAKKDIAFKVCEAALDKGEFDAYQIYEYLLPEHPEVVMLLSDDNIQRLADYVLNIRNKFKK